MIDIYESEDQWFQPVFFSDTWQVAMLSYAPQQALERLEKLDIHLKTDEVFILNVGIVALITADIQKSPYEYQVKLMKPGKVYNIPRNVWHNITMKEDSSVYIIENKDTHLGDFQFCQLDVIEKKRMYSSVNQIWNESI